MNLSTLTDLAAGLALDAGQTRFAGKYTQALNLAQQQFAFDTKCLWKTASVYTVVDGTAQYDLPSDFWLEKRVTHKGLRLDPVSRDSLDIAYQGSEDWTAISGTPTNFIIDPEEAAKKITLFRKPTGQDAGANLYLTYYAIPTDMNQGSDIPFNSSSLLLPQHIAVAHWAAWLLLGYEPTDAAKAKTREGLLDFYNAKVSEAVDTFKNTASEPLFIKGGR